MQSSAFLIAVFEFLILLFSLSVHESAHAWMASRLGDPTARSLGRVSLNPMDHVDPVGTLLFPALMIFGPFLGLGMVGGMLVGWAKPTPVNSRYFRNFVRDTNLVTLAGPASNLLLVLLALAVLAVLSLTLPNGHNVVLLSFLAALGQVEEVAPNSVVLICTLMILINLSLCFFNLLPIPPLDGSRVVRNLLPYNAVQTYDRIPIWASYLFMIFVGRYIIGALLSPAIGLILRVLMRL